MYYVELGSTLGNATTNIIVYLKMFRPNKIALFCWMLLYSGTIIAQSRIPYYFINTDIVYAAELIPTVGFEHFFMKRDHLRSWHIDAGYQFHYNDQFGFIISPGDVISIGVYQGPVVKLGYSYFTNWRNKKWINYSSPSLGIKYLWYNHAEVSTGDGFLDPGYRIQSEKCISLVPQVYFGQKRTWNHFCLDYYCGLQIPVKFRDKIISHEVDNSGVTNPNVPYTTYQVSASGDIVFGLKLGYFRSMALPGQEETVPVNDEEDMPRKNDQSRK